MWHRPRRLSRVCHLHWHWCGRIFMYLQWRIYRKWEILPRWEYWQQILYRDRGISVIEGVHTTWKQSISKEINEAGSEYMNMSPLNYRSPAVAVVCIFIYLYACCYIHTSLKICNPGISIFVKVLYAVLLKFYIKFYMQHQKISQTENFISFGYSTIFMVFFVTQES